MPDVTFTDGGRDATRDSPGLDGPAEAAADAEGDAPTDAADSGDAGADAPDYCNEAGPPAGFKCCMGVNGVVCGSTSCTSTACLQCATINCSWPSVCCGTGPTGTCKMAGGC